MGKLFLLLLHLLLHLLLLLLFIVVFLSLSLSFPLSGNLLCSVHRRLVRSPTMVGVRAEAWATVSEAHWVPVMAAMQRLFPPTVKWGRGRGTSAAPRGGTLALGTSTCGGHSHRHHHLLQEVPTTNHSQGRRAAPMRGLCTQLATSLPGPKRHPRGTNKHAGALPTRRGV
ncbi:hypothetical protein E2C01_068378 [Portunus trituberculatus]|uniref:Uncharacterized protein n=1 Tax=Portunus trituberculatus TaxID=210409 RepID=A0A5B7HVM4_PORTR|nr:hypothetical protein [Portunus trituberculatus]